ncbi:MAG: formimidoylglutamase [Flavobacteriales bacterium]|nr:formimidoylglutamase [Flavobacteriales bacterium]MBL4733759.1 formimidoylglutamase [Flavobacteriales bacterium]
MEIALYFEPVDVAKFERQEDYLPSQLGSVIEIHQDDGSFPDLEGVDLAIIGVKEERNAVDNEGCAEAPDAVRNKLYQLFQSGGKTKIADLGNIISGNKIEDTYFALSASIAALVENKIVPIIIGGSQDLTYANYTAYESLEQTINMVVVGPTFDLGIAGQELNSQNYLSKIILHQPNYLFNYSNIGYQSYFVDAHALELMRKLFFDAYRLGLVQNDIQEVEPIVRNADLLSFDMGSIRQSDAPGNQNASPNGFYGEQACQITRYAGLSDKLTSIGFYEINPKYDKSDQTVHLVAQMIWYFMEGYYNRLKDYPVGDKSKYTKYHVSIHDGKHEIVFYKSKKSDRWWMSIPYPENREIKFDRHHLAPCSYADYEKACDDDIPDRWLLSYQKLG